jgi:DNA-binding MarR family transcriptional regulator
MAKKSAADLDPSPGFGYLLARAHGLFRERMMQKVSGHGLHMGHVLILSLLLKRPASDKTPMTQTYLGKLTGIEKSSLVIFLDELEKQMWVKRVAHPSDRRAYVIKLTESGHERFTAVAQVLHAAEVEILSFMTKSQRGVFGEFLKELIQTLETNPDHILVRRRRTKAQSA